ncbi:hypothetical protein ACOME3_000484 [Neoechinorhynchus agilis]
MEINFSMNEISRLDDFTFPRCSICQSWGHWSQRCPTKKSVCAFCACNHHSSACPKDTKCCANCKKTEHCAFSKSCPVFKQYLNWAQTKPSANNNANIVRQAPNKQVVHESAPPSSNEWRSERMSPNQDSIDGKLRQFSDRIMQMVDLRINMAIQGLEKRLASHLDALMATISSRLDNMFPHGSIDSPISCKRIRKASPVNPNLPNSDVEMSENELFIRDIIQEQSQATPTAETTAAHEPTVSSNRQPKVRFAECVDVCVSDTEIVAVEKAISESYQTSIAECATSQAELPPSPGDPKNWCILGLCPFATTDQRTLIESILAIISRYPKKIYDVYSLVRK